MLFTGGVFPLTSRTEKHLLASAAAFPHWRLQERVGIAHRFEWPTGNIIDNMGPVGPTLHVRWFNVQQNDKVLYTFLWKHLFWRCDVYTISQRSQHSVSLGALNNSTTGQFIYRHGANTTLLYKHILLLWKGCSGNWTQDLSHPKRESYHYTKQPPDFDLNFTVPVIRLQWSPS